MAARRNQIVVCILKKHQGESRGAFFYAVYRSKIEYLLRYPSVFFSEKGRGRAALIWEACA